MSQVECGACGGEKEIKVTKTDRKTRKVISEEWKKCWICNGTGKVDSDYRYDPWDDKR
jgi:hypothetical protein